MNRAFKTLFGGSAFVRWAATPFILIFAIALPLAFSEWTPARAGIIVGMEIMCLCLLAGFWLPPRLGNYAFRIFAGFVFLFYAAYLVYEFFVSKDPTEMSLRRSQPSPLSATLGFIVIGIPALLYAVFGKIEEDPPQDLSSEYQNSTRL